jgi:hypothetical protein
MGLFGLKIGWDVARVLLPDLLYSGGDSNHDVGGHFCHLAFVHLSEL